jgi:general secretion pathway protein D
VGGCGSLSDALIQRDEATLEQAKSSVASGEIEAGIQQLQALSDTHPENAHFRNTLRLQKNIQVSMQLQAAEQKLQQLDYSEAEHIYQQILLAQPDHQRALEGVKRVAIRRQHQLRLALAQAAYANHDVDQAEAISRSILAEDASHTEAKTLYEKIEQQKADKLENSPQIKTHLTTPITVEFKNTSIKSVFEYLGKVSQLNFTFDRELPDSQQTSVFLKNTPIEEVIETLMVTNQLGKKILNSHTLLIYPIHRSHLYEEQYVRSFYLSHLDAKRAMNLVKTVLRSKDIYVDEKLNTLVMKDTKSAIKIAEKLIASQDLNDPEVMLEVEVMEINRKTLEDIGVKYPTQIGVGVQGKTESTNGTTAAVTPGRLTLAELKNFNSGLGVFTISDPVLALNILQQNTDTNLLANPQIRVRNRDKAKIHVGDKIPVLTSTANSTGFVTQTVSYIDVGIKLDVEPTILLQNKVAIKVGLEVSNIVDQVKTDSGVLAYTIGSRNANTTLQLKDGETQILAGLFKDDAQNITQKVPGLSNLPLIGRLFANKNQDRRKNEIVLLITPRILHNITPANALYSSFPAGIDYTQQGHSGAVMPAAPAVSVPSVQTPTNIQIEKSLGDQEFARQLSQPVISEPAIQPSAITQ